MTSISAVVAPGKRRSRRDASRPWIVHLALIVACLTALVPFLWMLSTSLKSLDNAMRFPPQWIPRPLMISNYAEVIAGSRADFVVWARNSFVIASLTVVGTTLSSAIVAYGFARLRFPRTAGRCSR